MRNPDRKDELQFYADAALIDRVLLIEAGLVHAHMVKTAEFEWGSIIKGIVDHLKDWAKQHIDTSSIGATINSVANVLVPGFLFVKGHPVLAVLFAAAAEMGFGIGDILSKVKDFVVKTLGAGNRPTPAEIDGVVRSAVSGMGASAAPNDLLQPLRKLSDEGRLVSLAASGGSSGMFSFLKKLLPAQVLWILGGFVGTAVKAVLAGVGLLVIAHYGRKLLGIKEDAPQAPSPDAPSEVSPQAQAPAETKPAHPLVPSGIGEKHHANTADKLWIVPVVGGSMHRTLMLWALDVYPELRGYQSALAASPAFNRIANVLAGYVNKTNPNYLIMPEGINTRKQVVDGFAAEVYQIIKKQKDQMLIEKGPNVVEELAL